MSLFWSLGVPTLSLLESLTIHRQSMRFKEKLLGKLRQSWILNGLAVLRIFSISNTSAPSRVTILQKINGLQLKTSTTTTLSSSTSISSILSSLVLLNVFSTLVFMVDRREPILWWGVLSRLRVLGVLGFQVRHVVLVQRLRQRCLDIVL